ncbi:hypothetical protein [Tenacibaculum jejuense]|uniref:Uncharacterized protein n=1 Tax=Tenacibaculum jejuense TaxID=584609 RepID=A0A238U649_9FLAO|nr:hypothetical protein [Tenacibaculum jejuense]SNR14476.1 protein of unknown function [Tenacibaculum jejuense]
MAISKKGFRKIIVENRLYYWKFCGYILVAPDKAKSENILKIDFGFYDPWNYINTNENIPPDFNPKIVTPKFVSESIKFALDKGWTEGKFNLKYSNNKYFIE